MALSEIVTILSTNKWELLLLAFFCYQLYWPSWLHPSEPKLRALFLRDTIGVLIEVVAQLASLHPDMNEKRVKEDLGVNGTQYVRKSPHIADGGGHDGDAEGGVEAPTDDTDEQND